MKRVTDSKDIEEKDVVTDASKTVESADIGVIPSPSMGEAVKVALDVAQSVGPEGGIRGGGLLWGVEDHGDSVSISQYVDEAERRAQSLFDQLISNDQSPLEKLEVLDVATEFGRPDELVDMSEELEGDDEGGLGLEDTQNLSVGVMTMMRPRLSKKEKPRKEPRVPTDQSDLKVREAFENSETEKAARTGTPSPADGEKQEHWLSAAESNPSLDTGRYEELSGQRVWDLLIRIYIEKKTGMLVLKQDDVTTRLLVDEGNVVMASTTSKNRSLLSALQESGYVDQTQWNDLVLREGVKWVARRLIVTLLQNSVIAVGDLFSVLRKYYSRIVADTFGWTKVKWRFVSEADLARERILLQLPIPNLVLEGIRSLNARTAEAYVPLDTDIPVRTSNALCHIDELGLNENEIAVYNAADGDRTIAELALLLERDEEEVIRLISTLIAVKLLVVGRDQSPPRPLEGARPRLVPDRLAVAAKLAEVVEGSYFDILGIKQGASGYEVRRAYLDLREQFRPEHFSKTDVADLGDQARLIRRILDEAYDVLSRPLVRDRYSHMTEKDFIITKRQR